MTGPAFSGASEWPETLRDVFSETELVEWQTVVWHGAETRREAMRPLLVVRL